MTRNNILINSFLASAAFATCATWAQPSSQRGLEEIVVTAQRRAENLQDVPVAVSAVTGSAIEKLGVVDTSTLTQLVPGFTFDRQAAAALPFIRGIGTQSGTMGNEPSIAQFVDDVYIPSSNSTIFEYNSIDTIEVLKGPQGTLFGRNATGGVIHIHTRNPTHEPALDISVGYGNYDTSTVQFYASGGLTENIAANVSAFRSRQGEGWGTNVTTGSDIYSNEAWGVRSKVLIEPDDSLSILLSGSFNKRESDQGMALAPVTGMIGRLGFDRDAAGLGHWDGASTHDSYYDSEYYHGAIKVSKDFTHSRLVSITSYSENDTPFYIFDLDAAPQDFLNADSENVGKTFTQEIQLLSPDDSDVSWILGAFLLHDKSHYSALYSGQVYGTGTATTSADQVTDSVSVFAQMTNEILPNTNLTIGARYTSDDRSLENAHASAIDANGIVTTFRGPFEHDETFKNMTGRIALDYKFSDDFMGYIAYNRGFKSGVYNLAGTSTGTTTAATPVEPEEVDAYTLGFKSEFMDSRVRLNMEAFYYEYTNIQVQNALPTGGGQRIVNGGEATIYGLEGELTVMPIDNLTISANFAAMDTEYDEFDLGPTFFPQPPNAAIPIPSGCGFSNYPTATGPMAQVGCNLAGNELVRAVPFSSSLSFIYTIPTEIGMFDLSASWAHKSSYYMEPDNNRFSEQDATDIINASVKWTSPGETFDVRLWGNNLTEEKYWSYIGHSTTSGTKGSPAAPRTYGVTLGYHFN
ncbi:MAG: TonB-dependent receptor [Porticoccaceae bacterium]